MPSSSEKGSSKRGKCASSGEVEFEDSSKNLSTKNDQNKDSKERCKSMSPRRNSWREDIKKIKGWREELKDRLKRRERSHRQSKVLCDRVTKRSSRLSRMRTLLCERVPSKQSSRVKLMKNGSGKRDTKKKKYEKSGSSLLHSEGEVLRDEGKFKIINNVDLSMGTDENGDLKGKKSALEENIHQQGTNGDMAEKDSSSSSQMSKHRLESLLSNSENKTVSVDEKVPSPRNPPLDEREDKKSTSQFVKRLAEHDQISWPPQYKHRLILNQEKNTYETSTPPSEEDDTGAMARNISLLELKMEVFTTRLKELEWEREQLRKERESFQAGFPELSSKRMSKPKEKEEDLFSMDEGGLRNKKK